MFYDTSSYRLPMPGMRDDRDHAIVVLLPMESRRLIARGILQMPEVERALDSGIVLVCRGISSSYVVEELTDLRFDDRGHCTQGIVTYGRLASTVMDKAIGPWVFRDGKLSDQPFAEALHEFTATDVAIKGANAVDPDGNVGILSGAPDGATIGMLWPIVTPRGSHLISAVGLEKLIPSVPDAAKRTGIHVIKHPMDIPVGLIPVTSSQVVTEIQALEILTGVTATHVASGGVAGSEGAVILVVEGVEAVVLKAFELVQSIKGEAAVPMPELAAGV